MLRVFPCLGFTLAFVTACSTTGTEPQAHPNPGNPPVADAGDHASVPAASHEPNSSVNADSKAEAKANTADAKAGNNPDSKAGNNPDFKAGNNPDAKAGNNPDFKAGTNPDSKAGSTAHANSSHRAADLAGPSLGSPGRDTPQGVVASFFAAATADDRVAALELMTPACRERETTWKKSFTQAIFERGKRPKTQALRSNNRDGNTAKLFVGATFVDADGRDDREGMRFELVLDGGKWWIVEIN